MSFFKDRLGIILFISSYILIIFLTFGIFITNDLTDDSFLIYHKTLFLIICILVILSHFQSAITNPGIITHENNVRVLELYISTHQHCIKNADLYNAKFKELLEQENEEDECITSDDNDDFGYFYDLNTQICDSDMNEICEKYKVKLTRCRKCLVVRVPNTHHCTKCKGCILKYDHHCPWINNCIGMFNRKPFILFCLYSFFGTLHGMIIVFYYYIYKDDKK